LLYVRILPVLVLLKIQGCRKYVQILVVFLQTFWPPLRANTALGSGDVLVATLTSEPWWEIVIEDEYLASHRTGCPTVSSLSRYRRVLSRRLQGPRSRISTQVGPALLDLHVAGVSTWRGKWPPEHTLRISQGRQSDWVANAVWHGPDPSTLICQGRSRWSNQSGGGDVLPNLGPHGVCCWLLTVACCICPRRRSTSPLRVKPESVDL
jgi:hypothetical protein